jgi:hypothetical protein
MNKSICINNLGPFKDITSYLMALIIVHKMFNLKKNNFQNVHKCLTHFINQCNINQTETFINFVSQYKNQYNHPFTFLINIEQFKQNINQYCIDNNEASNIIEVDIFGCVYCKTNNPFWFTNNAPKFQKKAILFKINGIGKKIFYNTHILLH